MSTASTTKNLKQDTVLDKENSSDVLVQDNAGTNVDPTHWPKVAARVAAEKTQTETFIFNVAEVLGIVEYFVVAGASNTRLVRTIVDYVEEAITVAGGPKPIRIEGLASGEWVLMDYGDFVVHVFLQAAREYYEIERLWSDVPKVDWQD